MDPKTYEIIILGTGPAGLQAAIHAARTKVSTLVMGRDHKSSLYRAHIENYCCLTGFSGETMLQEGIRQATASGAEFLNEDVIQIDPEGDRWFIIRTESGRTFKTRALIMAMGIARHKLGVAGEKKYFGKGVSYCVDCDANFYKGEKVVVIGNESAAVAGAMTLLFYAQEVHLIADALEVSDRLEYQVKESNVHVHEGRKVIEIVGNGNVEGVVLDDGTRLDVTGVFIELGAKGAIELASKLGVSLDSEKMEYIVADKQQQTNVAGIFAAGDICGPPWQMAKAVGEGCVAGLVAAKYVKKLR
jgi:thioredoxin reductase (NADPH)